MNLGFSPTTVLWKVLGGVALVATPLLIQPGIAADGSERITDAAVIDYSLSDGGDSYYDTADEPSEVSEPEQFITQNLADTAELAEAAASRDYGNPDAYTAGKKKKALAKKVKGAYKGLFYDNNFNYLCDPSYDGRYLGDVGKRRAVGDWGILDVGGQLRLRQMSEHNMRGLGLTGRSDDFLLYRTRLYANLEIGRRFRVYAEYLDAQSDYENWNPRPIEVNRSDMLNLFGELMLVDGSNGQLRARVGRQELLYGVERTISPLDWANTRRTFEGYKMFWEGKAWNADFFYVRPMKIDATHFDSPNYDREFMGTYLTYKKLKNATLDLYYLAYNNNDPTNAGDFNYDTFGARYDGAWQEVWLGTAEGAYQSGNTRGFNHDAGFYTVGLGRKFPCVTWKPTFWAYYDWASGDDVIGNGYDHMFPLAHKYMGFMDLFGRRNLTDFNMLLTANPTDRIKLLMWYHMFNLENGNDVPYNVNMSPYNPGNAAASKNLGDELDLIVSVKITPRTDILFGYSHFFAGDYYKLTPGVSYRSDADFVYTQFTVNF